MKAIAAARSKIATPCALRLMSVYRMCPPSSCPIGIRLSAVTKIPTQPANNQAFWITM